MYTEYRAWNLICFLRRLPGRCQLLVSKSVSQKKLDCFQLFNPHNRYRESAVFFGFVVDIHVLVFLLPGVRG